MTKSVTENYTKVTQSAKPLQVIKARTVLFWERVWPALLPILTPISLFVIFSLFNGWASLPFWAHWLGLVSMVVFTALAVYRGRDEFQWPSRREALQRLELDGVLRHTPLQALEDTPFSTPDFQKSPNPNQARHNQAKHHALWVAHQEAMEKAARRAKLKAPFATADQRDPFALRFIVMGMLFLGALMAGSQSITRLQQGFLPGTASYVIASQADMWVEPPAYTGLAPLYLVRAGEPLPDLADQIDVPAGSTLIAQINGRRGASLTFTNTEAENISATQPEPETLNENERHSSSNRNAQRLQLSLTENGLIDLHLAEERGLWPVLVLPDEPPIVSFLSPPEEDKNRALKIHYQFEDDFGAVEAHLVFKLDPDQDRPLDGLDLEEDALQATRRVVLEGAAGGSGERRHTVPLESDPWAGLQVIAHIEVSDGAKQIGVSEEETFRLPGREFFNPLAKAVIEQRQNLAVAASQEQHVRDALTGLTTLPEEFFEDTSEYLLMQTAFWRVQLNKADTQEETIEHFWPLALELEDKALELARRRLEAAFEALRRALEANASEEEINRLNTELSDAINDYLQALAQAGVPDTPPGGGEGNQIGTNTIQEMLDSIDELSDAGANNAARQMLGDLESLIENLRLSRGGGGGENGIPNPGGEGSEGGASEQAGELIGRQRELSDKTFERNQESDGSGGDLAREQEELGEALEDILESLEQQQQQNGGTGTGGASDALREALREMQRAEGALDRDNFDSAGRAMDRVIENLREGAQALAQEEQARNERNAQNGENNGQGNEDGQEGVDPLGRRTGSTSGQVEVPDTIDPALTRELIEKMRERLSKQGRSQEEIDYLERLLEAF